MEADLIVGGLLFHDNVRQICKEGGIRVVRLSKEVSLGLTLSSTRLGPAARLRSVAPRLQQRGGHVSGQCYADGFPYLGQEITL